MYFAHGAADTAIAAAASGADLLAVGGAVNGLTQAIVAGKNYKSIKNLRGATIGVQGLTSGGANVLKRVLKQNGLDYPADYKVFATGGGSSSLAALTSGQIAATYLPVPFDYTAEQGGFNVIGYFKDYFPNYQLSVLAVKRGWAEKTEVSWCASSRGRCARIVGSMRTKKRRLIFSPRKSRSIPSSLAKGGNTIRQTGSYRAFRRRAQESRMTERVTSGLRWRELETDLRWG